MITRHYINCGNGWGYMVISDGVNSVTCDVGEEDEAIAELEAMRG